jgi:hypothetical protein
MSSIVAGTYCCEEFRVGHPAIPGKRKREARNGRQQSKAGAESDDDDSSHHCRGGSFGLSGPPKKRNNGVAGISSQHSSNIAYAEEQGDDESEGERRINRDGKDDYLRYGL